MRALEVAGLRQRRNGPPIGGNGPQSGAGIFVDRFVLAVTFCRDGLANRGRQHCRDRPPFIDSVPSLPEMS